MNDHTDRSPAVLDVARKFIGTMSRRFWARSHLGRSTLGLVTLALFLSACVTPMPTPTPQPVTLIFACSEIDASFYRQAADQFQQINPSVKIQLVHNVTSLDAKDDWDSLRQLATHADVFLWSAQGVEGGPVGLVSDLSPWVKSDPEMVETAFLPGLASFFQWQGSTWGIPAGVAPLLILYDPAVFDEAGLAHPRPGWTWDDLFAAAQRLTRREGERIVRYGIYLGIDAIRSAVDAQGGRLVDDTRGVAVPLLDEPRTVSAVRWYTDLALTHQVAPNPTESEWADPVAAVRTGRAAMGLIMGQGWSAANADLGRELSVAPLPGQSRVGLNGYYISQGTAHPQAAWRWIQFLSQNFAPPGLLPARQSLISDSTYAQAVGEPGVTASLYAAEHALPPIHPAAVERLFYDAVGQVYAGQEAQDVLRQAQLQAVSLAQPDPVEPFSVVAPEADSPPSAERITFVTTYAKMYEPLIPVFQAQHPEIEVVALSFIEAKQSDSNYWEGPAEFFDMTGADCIIDSAGHLSDADVSSLLDLQPFIEADPSFPLADYVPWSLELLRYEGSLRGLPAGLAVNVLYFNRALFDDSQTPYPEADWDWDNLFHAARQLTGAASSGADYGFIAFRTALRSMFVDEILGSSSPRFNDPDTVATVEQLSQLAQDQVIQIEDELLHFDLVWAGRVGMWFGTARAFEDPRFQSIYAPQLKSSGYHAMAYYIAADTAHPQACWQWLRFLSEQMPLKAYLPPRYSLLTSEAFRAQVGAEAQTIYMNALNDIEPARQESVQVSFHTSVAYLWFDQALQAILEGKSDAQPTLDEAQVNIDAYLNCCSRQTNPDDPQAVQKCVEQVDPDLARMYFSPQVEP